MDDMKVYEAYQEEDTRGVGDGSAPQLTHFESGNDEDAIRQARENPALRGINWVLYRQDGDNLLTKVIVCGTCKIKSGKRRTDNGLDAGIHCDECWTKMVDKCRSRSW